MDSKLYQVILTFEDVAIGSSYEFKITSLVTLSHSTAVDTANSHLRLWLDGTGRLVSIHSGALLGDVLAATMSEPTLRTTSVIEHDPSTGASNQVWCRAIFSSEQHGEILSQPDLERRPVWML